jgi:hypothetical protein
VGQVDARRKSGGTAEVLRIQLTATRGTCRRLRESIANEAVSERHTPRRRSPFIGKYGSAHLFSLFSGGFVNPPQLVNQHVSNQHVLNQHVLNQHLLNQHDKSRHQLLARRLGEFCLSVPADGLPHAASCHRSDIRIDPKRGQAPLGRILVD